MTAEAAQIIVDGMAGLAGPAAIVAIFWIIMR